MKNHLSVLGAIFVAGGLAYLFLTGFQQSTSTHVTLASLRAGADREAWAAQRLQVGGCYVAEGSIQWDRYHHRPEFTVTDGKNTLRVHYTGNGVLPDTFKDQSSVVLEGHYLASQNIFDAKVIFAKCPSKYEGQSYELYTEAMRRN